METAVMIEMPAVAAVRLMRRTMAEVRDGVEPIAEARVAGASAEGATEAAAASQEIIPLLYLHTQDRETDQLMLPPLKAESRHAAPSHRIHPPKRYVAPTWERQMSWAGADLGIFPTLGQDYRPRGQRATREGIERANHQDEILAELDMATTFEANSRLKPYS